MHQFITGREAGGTKPIYGLTASILIHAASVGYVRQPEFQVYAPGQLEHKERIRYAMRHSDILRNAQLKKGIDPDRNDSTKQRKGEIRQVVMVRSRL
ncbi:hypothetical protein PHLCEN_2v5734 [Hermanssonia centrifuga]|uniref:Uncharacterized protein n=1 Tax=Hermanssonia centrifuga TaxID=98765 RepID=A0A2R6P1J8_9APHY|nr:hypothetical protein PHLCEN_2v5734 [Hermanssonia centrifuga]